MSADETYNSDPLDEELVAYLDDEVEAIARVRIERRLADDVDYRERLRHLQQTWDALDLLPRASASDAFTSSTMSLVVQEQQIAAAQGIDHLNDRRVRRWLIAAICTAAAVAIGFLLVYRRLTDTDRSLVRDLPVIEQVDQLHNTPSLEFLEQLREERLFSAETQDE